MADSITIKALQDASLDAKSLEEVVNGDDAKQVTTRLGETYPSVKKALKELFENGGIADRFKTLADLQTSPLVDGDYALVADDTDDKNGIYIKEGGAWVKSKYNPSAISKEYGFAKISAAPATNINYNTATGYLELRNNVLIATSTERVLLTTPKDLKFDTTGLYRLEFNQKLNDIRVVRHDAYIVKDWLTVAIIYKDNSGIYSNDFTDYSIDGVATLRTINDKVVEGSLYVFGDNIVNVNTVANKLEFKVSRIVYLGRTFATPAVTIDLPTAGGLYRIEYNQAEKTYTLVPSYQAININNIILGRLSIIGDVYEIHGIAAYQIDGKSPSAASEGVSIKFGKLLPIEPEQISILSKENQIKIVASKVRIIYNYTTVLLPATTITIDNAYLGWYAIHYDAKTKVFGATPATSPMPVGVYVVAYYNHWHKIFDGIEFYNVDGRPAGNLDLTELDYYIPPMDFSKDYKPTTDMPSAKDIYDMFGDLDAFYGLYDALQAANPEYITSKVLANDKDGRPIKQYRFSEAPPPVARNSKHNVRPKIILISNVHGEPAGTANTYNTLKHICEQWQTDESLEAIRFGVDLVVVPIANPYAFINGSRKNGNGVDIARNFPIGWVAGSDTTANTYSGTAPLSEIESQTVDALLMEHKDAVAFISHHSMVGLTNYTLSDGTILPDGAFIWIPANSHFTRNLGQALVNRITVYAKNKYPFIKQRYDGYLGFADKSAPPGSESLLAGSYGIQGSTFETNQWLKNEDGTPIMSSTVTTLGVVTLVNWLLLNLRHAPDMYNLKKVR